MDGRSDPRDASLAPDDQAPEPSQGARAPGSRVRAWARDARHALDRHEAVLWWMHSGWALACGIAVASLGARHFVLLRIAFAQVAFIWATSLLLPYAAGWQRLSPGRRGALRLLVNYFNKNFYQQLLFFVLPVYWASVTPDSPNVLFVAVIAASAVLSTFDVVYDRHLSVKRSLTALFFAFNLFACANVALPVLWGISNASAMRVSAMMAVLGYATLRFHVRDLADRRVLALLVVVALGLGLALEVGRRLIPPAPLTLVRASFGPDVRRHGPAIPAPFATLPRGWSGRLYAVTAIRAPLGLRDRIRHRWTVGGRTVHVSPYYAIAGGRTQGFRLWTSAVMAPPPTAGVIRVDVETEGGQLIGRARLPIGAGR